MTAGSLFFRKTAGDEAQHRTRETPYRSTQIRTSASRKKGPQSAEGHCLTRVTNLSLVAFFLFFYKIYLAHPSLPFQREFDVFAARYSVHKNLTRNRHLSLFPFISVNINLQIRFNARDIFIHFNDILIYFNETHTLSLFYPFL